MKKSAIWIAFVFLTITGLYWAHNSRYGHVFFPIGMYGAGGSVFSELKAAGFNCVVSYETNEDILSKWVEEAEMAGLKVIVPPHLKNGKNVLAWYLADEPDVHGIRPEDLDSGFRRNDGKYIIPTAIVVGRGQAAALYRDVCDIIMIDWYPVPHLPLESVGEHVSEAVAAANPGQPVWAIIQAFPWSVFSNKAKSDKTGQYNRPPTYEEMNKMVQFAVSAGASGILFYTFQGNGWKITDDLAYWDNVKKTARSLSSSLSLGGIKGTGFPLTAHGNDDLMLWLKVMGTGLITTLLLTPLAKLLGRKFGLTDRPDGELKNHKLSIPYTGGLAIWIGISAGIVAAMAHNGSDKLAAGELGNSKMMAIMLGSLVLIILGLVDDIRAGGLTPTAKMIVEIVAGMIVVASGIQFNFTPWKLANVIATIAVIVAMCNAVNLLDGLDGLAGGVIAISIFFLFIMAISQGQTIAATLCLALLGACLGFMAYNISPANVFMGNSGSLLLGFGAAVIALLIITPQTDTKHVISPFVAMGVPVAEMTITVARRLMKGLPVFTGDRNHVYDLLAKTKLGQNGTVFTFWGVTMMLGAFVILSI